ncbi:MAG: hypothetical protein U0271_34630 [Polyangiaceae bacterium]
MAARVTRHRPIFIAGAATLFAAATAGCGGSGAACTTDHDTCGAGYGCVVGACRPVEEALVAVEASRLVLPARRVAVLSSADLPENAFVTPFGASSAGDVIVLMSFEADVGPRVSVEGAYLVLDAEPVSPGPTEPIDLSVAPILGEWERGPLSWARAPRLGVALGSSRVMPARRVPLRVDVTSHVARLHGVGFGLAVVARGDDPVGARLITAPATSNGPRLELYLR